MLRDGQLLGFGKFVLSAIIAALDVSEMAGALLFSMVEVLGPTQQCGRLMLSMQGSSRSMYLPGETTMWKEVAPGGARLVI